MMQPTVIDRTNLEVICSINDREEDWGTSDTTACYWQNESWWDSFKPWRIRGQKYKFCHCPNESWKSRSINTRDEDVGGGDVIACHWQKEPMEENDTEVVMRYIWYNLRLTERILRESFNQWREGDGGISDATTCNWRKESWKDPLNQWQRRRRR